MLSKRYKLGFHTQNWVVEYVATKLKVTKGPREQRYARLEAK
jgi:hypothetical protein